MVNVLFSVLHDDSYQYNIRGTMPLETVLLSLVYLQMKSLIF